MTTYYKATRENGTDFHTGTIDYAAALGTGVPVTHPGGTSLTDASDYLSVSTSPTDCTGFSWPCRLFVVEPVAPWTPHAAMMPNKRACRSLLVTEERPAHEAFGPNGAAVVAVIERASRLTGDEVVRLAAAWDAAWNAAWDAAWDAAGAAAWNAAWNAAGAAAWNAARTAVGDAARTAVGDAARDAAWDAARAAAQAAARAAARAAAWNAAWDAVGDAAWNAARDAAGAAAWDAAWDAAQAAAWDAVAHCVRDLITPEQFDLLTGPWESVVGGAA